MSDEQPDLPQIDVRNNPESKAYGADTTQRVARASDGGPPPAEAPPTGEMPEQATEGTAAGSPVAGVEIGPADRDDAVEPDQGAMEVEGPSASAGHA